jgi:hypothetical protein
MGELECTRGVWELYAPLDGVVAEVNQAAAQNPEHINEDPYGDGWLVRLSLRDKRQLEHLLTAYAKGVGPVRILLWHVLPVAGAQLLAVAGISVSIALGAAIPVEALCGIAGIGQLAWQAALGRDLPLLVNLTVLVTVITLAANWGSEFAGQRFRTSDA